MGRGKKTEAKADDGRGVPPPGGKPWDTTMRKAWGDELELPKIWHEGEWIQPIIDPDIRAALPDMDGDVDNPTERERAREALYNSLREHGLYQPVILCEVEGHHVVLDGHDRLEAWARLLKEIPDWDPPLKLRAELISYREIVGDLLDPLVCDCLLIGRAVSINCVRRRLTPQTVRKLIVNQLMREARANFNRASKWIARDLGCSLQYLQDIRKGLWAAGTIPCPPKLLGQDDVERDNPSYSHESKSYKPISKVRQSPKADAFEPEKSAEQKAAEEAQAAEEEAAEEAEAAEAAEEEALEEAVAAAYRQHLNPSLPGTVVGWEVTEEFKDDGSLAIEGATDVQGVAHEWSLFFRPGLELAQVELEDRTVFFVPQQPDQAEDLEESQETPAVEERPVAETEVGATVATLVGETPAADSLLVAETETAGGWEPVASMVADINQQGTPAELAQELTDWNSQRERPFDVEYLEWLHDSGFLWVEAGEVHYLPQDDTSQFETALIRRLSPMFCDVEVDETALGAAIHRLLHPTAKPRSKK